MPPAKLHWYDGGLTPPRPESLPDDKVMTGERNEGLLFIGDKGTIMCGFSGRNPRLLPESKMKNFEPPPKTLPRSPGNEREWLDACKWSKTKPGAKFEFSDMVTEALLLGNVALRVEGKLKWDRSQLTLTNAPSADKCIRPEVREGWGL